ncbi:hypothetical protein SUGI_0271290 [Cryptomeria japonica]|nr:hypothetical protein SUGI_0271290 [Cryptomeria japonica]
MEWVQKRVEAWIEQRQKQGWRWEWKWNWPLTSWGNQEEEKYKLRRRYQLQLLCHAVKVDTIADLQDILCAMVLSECVYKVTLFLFLFIKRILLRYQCFIRPIRRFISIA